jgi:hypothetical protein
MTLGFPPAFPQPGKSVVDYQEYERRRRAIEEQLHADLELIRAGYQAKLQALDALWLGASAERRDAPPEEPTRAETRIETLASAAIETLASAEAQTASPFPAEPPRKSRRGDVLNDILDILPLLPDVFDKADVVRLLGYEPTRPTLHRAWSRLILEHKIDMERASDGRRPTRFRKLPTPET